MRKRWALALAVILAVGSLAGCGQGTEDGNGSGTSSGATDQSSKEADDAAGKEQGEEQDNQQSVGDSEKYDTPISVTMVNVLSDDMQKQLDTIGETVEENRWTKRYQDELNINIEYKWVAKPEAEDSKFNLMLISSDMPDIMRVSSSQFRQLLEADMLEDLTDLYEEYMCEEYKQVAAEDPVMLKSSTFDGKLYGIPREPTTPYANTQQLWIRSDWLEALDLEEPKTMDDVIAIARAFKENKMGGEDTYGINFNKDSFTAPGPFTPGFTGFCNSYHAYPNMWIEKDGKLENGSLQPEMKHVLEVMHELYQEGIIDKEFATKDGNQYNQDLMSGKVGITYMWLGYGLGIGDFKRMNPEGEWSAYQITSCDDQPALPQSTPTVEKWYVVRKGCEHPEALFKMANLQIHTLSGEGSFEAAPDGTTNAEYYGAPADAPSMFDVCNFYFGLTMDGNVERFSCYDAALKRDPSNVKGDDMAVYQNLVAYEEGDISQWCWNRTFGGPKGGAEVAWQYREEGKLQINSYLGLPTETMAEKGSTLNQLEAETFTKIVMGEESIDAFDDFVEKWLALGGQDITDEVNEWYAANN